MMIDNFRLLNLLTLLLFNPAHSDPILELHRSAASIYVLTVFSSFLSLSLAVFLRRLNVPRDAATKSRLAAIYGLLYYPPPTWWKKRSASSSAISRIELSYESKAS